MTKASEVIEIIEKITPKEVLQYSKKAANKVNQAVMKIKKEFPDLASDYAIGKTADGISVTAIKPQIGLCIRFILQFLIYDISKIVPFGLEYLPEMQVHEKVSKNALKVSIITRTSGMQRELDRDMKKIAAKYDNPPLISDWKIDKDPTNADVSVISVDTRYAGATTGPCVAYTIGALLQLRGHQVQL